MMAAEEQSQDLVQEKTANELPQDPETTDGNVTETPGEEETTEEVQTPSEDDTTAEDTPQDDTEDVQEPGEDTEEVPAQPDEPETPAEEPQPEPSPAPQPDVYSREDLIAAHEQFDTTPELMAGALYGVTEPITKETARRRLNAFLKKEV
jgi:hypothetical protein